MLHDERVAIRGLYNELRLDFNSLSSQMIHLQSFHTNENVDCLYMHPVHTTHGDTVFTQNQVPYVHANTPNP
jgi:hypothetical protein